MAGSSSSSSDLKLLGVWTSPFVIRVRVVLNLKSLPCEYVEENLSSKSALLLGSNPVHKSVPVLLHRGRPVNESQVIVQYIDEVWAGTGPSVLPADPYERAMARFWAADVDDKVSSPWFTILFARKTEEKMEAASRVISALETLEGAFEGLSKGRAFFGGDGIGLVDVALGCYLGWFMVIEKMIGVELLGAARTPVLAAWAERFKVADAVKGVLPQDVDKVLAFLQTLLD